jgi:hypothetical protein
MRTAPVSVAHRHGCRPPLRHRATSSPDGKPSHLTGVVVFWLIFLFALSSAISARQIPALTTFIVAALLISVFAAVVALAVAIATFTHPRTAPAIVTITYMGILGVFAGAGALAFGLGGREVAVQMWARAYENGHEQTEQVKADAEVRKDRTQQHVEHAQHDLDTDNGSGWPAPRGADPEVIR